MTVNQMALHTESGCTASSDATQSGTAGSTTDCSNSSGCTVTDTETSSYGEGFAAAGGGAWAMQFNSSGI